VTRLSAAAVAGAAVLTITACGGGQAGPSGPAASAAPGVVSHAQALHLAGRCIRQHGIPGFPDPTVDATGQVTISKTQLLAVSKAVLNQAMTACRGALGVTGLADPDPVTGDLRLPPGMTKDSPVLLRAQRACRSLLPGNG
jgi:hypothetical protein